MFYNITAYRRLSIDSGQKSNLIQHNVKRIPGGLKMNQEQTGAEQNYTGI